MWRKGIKFAIPVCPRQLRRFGRGKKLEKGGRPSRLGKATVSLLVLDDPKQQPVPNKIREAQAIALAFFKPTGNVSHSRRQPIRWRADKKADFLQMRRIIGECRRVGKDCTPSEYHLFRDRELPGIPHFAECSEAVHRRGDSRKRTENLFQHVRLCPVLNEAANPQSSLPRRADCFDLRHGAQKSKITRKT